MLVNASAVGRDPSVWSNAKPFEPERFLGLEVDAKGQHFELIPFGAGWTEDLPCVGFANMIFQLGASRRSI